MPWLVNENDRGQTLFEFEMPDDSRNVVLSAKITNGVLYLFGERPQLMVRIDLAEERFQADTFYFLTIALRGRQQHV